MADPNTADYYRVTIKDGVGFVAYNETFLAAPNRSYTVSAAIYNSPDLVANGKAFKDICASADPVFAAS